MASYRLTEPACDDLLALASYIARGGVAAAGRVVDELEEAMETLAGMPGMGHSREDLTGEKGLLFWSVRSYLIVYRTGTHPLEVIRIVHGHRDVEEGLKS